MFKAYYSLIKPGIIFGNAITATAGFLLASSIKEWFDFGLFAALLLGTSLVIACGCVINNYIDRNIDAKMSRTKNRASVTGLIRLRDALIYAVILGVLGFSILLLYTNGWAVIIGAVGLFFYLVMYSLFKRRSTWGTVIGSVAGATPIAAGYVAVTDNLDRGAVILFLSMVLWQMPHFYSIAIYRFNDYKAAGLPVLPIKKSIRITKIRIIVYIIAFIAVVSSLSFAKGYTGNTYLVIMIPVGLVWLHLALQGFKTKNNKRWARKMFQFSLVVVLSLSISVSVGSILP